MVQVDLAGIAGRGGATFAEAPLLVEQCREAGLDVVGVMGVGSPPGSGATRAEIIETFRCLRALRDELAVTHCSMGMTDDLDDAVAAGATMVRVGSALFGARDGI